MPRYELPVSSSVVIIAGANGLKQLVYSPIIPHKLRLAYTVLQYVLGDTKPEDWNYVEVFPQLKRCLAVLVGSITLCCFPS